MIGGLCSADEIATAERWGLALRLGQRFSGGVADALIRSRLALGVSTLDLHIEGGNATLYGEPVERRHRTLAAAFGREARLVVE